MLVLSMYQRLYQHFRRTPADLRGRLRKESPSFYESFQRVSDDFGLLWKAIWCPWPGSNQHSLRNSILSRARLPIPPQGHAGQAGARRCKQHRGKDVNGPERLSPALNLDRSLKPGVRRVRAPLDQRSSRFVPPERWQSGRMRRTRNAKYGQPYRGFESLPLRH